MTPRGEGEGAAGAPAADSRSAPEPVRVTTIDGSECRAGDARPVAYRTASTLSLRGTRGAGPLYAHGSIWVTTYGVSPDWARLVRIDPKTLKVEAVVPLPGGTTGWEVGNDGLASGFGSVWVAGRRGNVHRVDAQSSCTEAIYRLGRYLVGDVEAASSGVWVSLVDAELDVHVGHIDPSTELVRARVRVPGQWAREVLPVGRHVLVHTRNPTRLSIVDARTHRIAQTRALRGVYHPFVARRGMVWGSAGDALAVIEPRTGAIADRLPLDESVSGTALVPHRGDVWFVAYDSGNASVPATIARFDPSTGTVAQRFPYPGGTRALTVAAGAVWTFGANGKLTRLDLRS